MKIFTIFGTRPEIIRLSLIIKKLDRLCDHIIINTGQNYDPKLNDIFLEELGIRNPDYDLSAKGSFGNQIAKIFPDCEKLMVKSKPDKLLILGDTNSGLSAIVAKKLGIKVYHMEAGNRCYDDRVPEEVNRRIIDHSSDILLPYTKNSRKNLIIEGFKTSKIIVTGNPIKEVLDSFNQNIDQSEILSKLTVKKRNYFLITLHRAENVDEQVRLNNFIRAFNDLAGKYKIPLIWAVHPRTREKINTGKTLKTDKEIKLVQPLGLFDFVHLEKNALCVLTDSGTVSEECCIFKIPSVILRDVTERPEILEVGSSVLSGSDPKKIIKCVNLSLKQKNNWNPPREYVMENVSETVINLLLGKK